MQVSLGGGNWATYAGPQVHSEIVIGNRGLWTTVGQELVIYVVCMNSWGGSPNVCVLCMVVVLLLLL